MLADVEELIVKVHANKEGFESLRGEWTALLQKSHCQSVFMTWEWLYGWWVNLGQEECDLRIVELRNEEGRLVGIGPFCIAPAEGWLSGRVLTFLGTTYVSSEYLDLLVETGFEQQAARAVVDAFFEKQEGWDYFSFPDMLESAIVLSHLVEIVRSRGFFIDITTSQTCPYLTLPTSVDGFYRSLGQHMRAGVRRRRRKLLDVGAEIRTIERLDSDMSALDSFFQLHEKRWGLKGRDGNFKNSAVRSFHRQVAKELGEQGALRLYRLELHGQPFGKLYGFQFKGKFFYYQSGFDPKPPHSSIQWSEYSPGIVLVSQAIQDSIEHELGEFDFLRGLESYKLRWTDTTRDTKLAIGIPPSAWGLMALYQSRQWLKKVKQGIRRTKMAMTT